MEYYNQQHIDLNHQNPNYFTPFTPNSNSFIETHPYNPKYPQDYHFEETETKYQNEPSTSTSSSILSSFADRLWTKGLSKGWSKGSMMGGWSSNGNSAAVSALGLLAFLFFLNLIQTSLVNSRWLLLGTSNSTISQIVSGKKMDPDSKLNLPNYSNGLDVTDKRTQNYNNLLLNRRYSNIDGEMNKNSRVNKEKILLNNVKNLQKNKMAENNLAVVENKLVHEKGKINRKRKTRKKTRGKQKL